MVRVIKGPPLLRGKDYVGLVHVANPTHNIDINPRWAWCELLHQQIIGIAPNSAGPDEATTCLLCIALEAVYEPTQRR